MANTTENDPRWALLLARSCSESFVYAVITTGVYGRANCCSRRPKPSNVIFFDSAILAESAGYRACLRCRPADISHAKLQAQKMSEACHLIQTAEEEPSLKALATMAQMSVFHFQRTFKSCVGITPKSFAKASRMNRLREALALGDASITTAMYEAGFRSSSRFYETATQSLGMTPARFAQGGTGVRIVFAVGECSLGTILVACSLKGVCAILFGDSPEDVLLEFQSRFASAELVGGDTAYDRLIARVIAFVDAPQLGLDLPLDLQGTSFQERVWQQLRKIPFGSTASYADIASAIGAPKSFRAVAQACGANAIAVAIPCHRVVRSDGGLSGYRWGIDRKRQLIASEKL